jgi:hypothetical protein
MVEFKRNKNNCFFEICDPFRHCRSILFPQGVKIIIMEYFSNFKLVSTISPMRDVWNAFFYVPTLSPQLWKVGERVAGK